MENITLSQILDNGEAMKLFASELNQEDLYKVYDEARAYLSAAAPNWFEVVKSAEINEAYEGLLTAANFFTPREVVEDQRDHALLLISFSNGVRSLEV